MLGLNLSNIAMISIKGGDYRCIIYDISKSEVENSLRNSVLDIAAIYKNVYRRNQY